MKKQYTIIALMFAVIMFFGYPSVAQKYSKQLVIQNKADINLQTPQLAKIKNSPLLGVKSKSVNANTTILSQDFSSTTFPPSGWTEAIVSGTATLDWTRGTALTYLNTAGTTFANGYAWVNSDGYGNGHPAENCALKSPVINCSTYTNVWVKFNEFFVQYAASTAHLEVSTNGTTWTTVHSSETGLAQDQSTANPNLVDVDLTSYAAGQATVYLRFHWTGQWDYFWMVDDIQVYSRPTYDAALISATNPKEYVVQPLAQYTGGALALAATAKNMGASTLTNVNMDVKVFNLSTTPITLVHSTTSNTLSSLAANATGLLTATTAYTPPSDTSIYYIEYLIHSAQADADLSNDTLYSGFWISDSLYARSDEMFTSQLDGSLGLGTGLKGLFGNDFTLTAADKLSHIDAYVTGPAIGDTTQMFVYATGANGIPTTQLASTATYKFTAAGGQWVSLPLQGGALSLAPGTYYVGLKEFTATNNIGLAYTNDNYTHLKTWYQIGAAAFKPVDDTANYYCSFIVEPYLVCASFMTNITDANDTICPGTPTTLTAINGLSYSWSTGAITPSITVSPTSTATYTVTATNKYGCTDTDNFTITVNPAPTAFAVTGGGSFCSSGTGLAVGLSSSQTGVNYQLQANGVNTGSPVAGTGSAISFGNQTSAGTYTVIATNATTTCTNNMTGSAVITITTTPVAFVVSGTTAICSGASTSIALSGSANGVNYQLYNGASTVGSAIAGTGSALSFSSITTAGTYTVVGTAGTCTTNMTGNAVITVNPSPTADAGTDQSITTGSTATLAGSVTGGTGTYNYLWSPAGSLVTANVQNPTTTALTVTTTYTLTVTDQATGCTGTDQVIVTVTGGTLSATCPAASGPVCQGSSVSLTTNVSGGTLPYNYLWTAVPTDPTLASQNTLPSPLVTPVVNTVYSVVITDGASNTASCSVSITVDPTMTTTTSETDATCGSSDGTATASVTTGGASPFNFVWNTTPAQTTATATGLPQGTYNVTVSDANGCTATNTITVNCVTGTTEYSNSTNFSIAPNPSNGSFSMVLRGYNGKATIVSIFDLKGQLLFNDNWTVNSDNYSQKLNLENLNKGVYYVRLVTKGSIKTVKLVIE